MGGMGKKSTQKAFQRLADIPTDKMSSWWLPVILSEKVFHERRLDTLFSHADIMERYAAAICGRLHRLFKTKKEVRIYDYVDIQVKMLERMYQKRLNGYASMGYKAKGEEIEDASFFSISFLIKITSCLFSTRISAPQKKRF